MCVVSMVTGGMEQQWPRPQFWQKQDLQEVTLILKKLDELDKKMGAKDCSDNALKVKYIELLEKRIADLEAKETK